MKEIGGYIELDSYHLPMLHENTIKLNCGRNALWYLIKARNIKRIWMPKFMCDSCNDVLRKENVLVRHYSIGIDFKPIDIALAENEWLYVVNFYGQLTKDDLLLLKQKYQRIIVDNAQAYFQMPLDGVDTLYTCRKFFGVADGATLYTDVILDEEMPRDESFERMHFLLGRFERSASEFYSEYVANNHFFINEPIKRMSKLTENLLHGIDYDFVKEQRTQNFAYLHKSLETVNLLKLTISEGAFMYPMYVEGGEQIRKKLQLEKIYIPTLWPAVFALCGKEELEFDMAKNILPIPVDQRYTVEDMIYLAEKVLQCMENNCI